MFEKIKSNKEDLARKGKKVVAVGALALTMGGGLSACGDKVDAKPGSEISASAPSPSETTPTPIETFKTSEPTVEKNTITPERMSEVIKELKLDPETFESKHTSEERRQFAHDYIIGQLTNPEFNTFDTFAKGKYKPFGIEREVYDKSGAADYVSPDAAVSTKANIFYDEKDTTLEELEAKRVVLGMVANQIPDSYADNDTTKQDDMTKNIRGALLWVPELQEQPGASHINSTTFKSPSIANVGTGLSQLSKGKNEVGEYIQYKADSWSTYHVSSITVYTGVLTKDGDKVNVYLENTSAATRNAAIEKAEQEAATE